MKTYSFTVILDESKATEEMANRLYEAGCDDCLPGSRHGDVVVGFDREAKSLEDAVTSAVENIKLAGYKIRHVTIEADSVEAMASAT